MQESIESTYEESARKNAVLIESLTALETIKALGVSGQSQWKWEEATGSVAHKGLRSKILSNSISTFVNFIVQLNTVAMIIGGVLCHWSKRVKYGWSYCSRNVRFTNASTSCSNCCSYLKLSTDKDCL